MANENKTADLRTAMQQLDPTTYQEIRESYYRIADNLKPLADALEQADADQGGRMGGAEAFGTVGPHRRPRPP